ncbi:hypothetical protein [Hoeflea sp.]|uniref:hypothetical protein n=1 Tax=Hoeflea sp. TaxID=1940281 RepID=UPI0019CD7516|nr:hypothetical protein [Hoeflea sp.]MBC7284268.1 hypothetical protein [Hoeflea sp.]
MSDRSQNTTERGPEALPETNLTNEAPDSPLVKKLVGVVRAHPQGVEAGLQKVILRIDHWLDEQDVDDDLRRKFQIRLDQVLAGVRKQLLSDDIRQSAPADVAENPRPKPGADDAIKPARLGATGRVAGALALAAIVAVGLGWGMGLFPSLAPRPLFALDAATSIVPGKQNRIERAPGMKPFSVFSTAKGPTSGGATGGAYLALDSAIEDLASGRTVRITIEAGPVSDLPSREFAVAYSTAAVGNSGWTRFQLDSGLQTWSFEYAVPKRRPVPGRDFIGIWADTTGGGGGVRIEDIRVELVEKQN